MCSQKLLRKIPDEEKNSIIQEYKNGMTKNQLSIKYRRNFTTIDKLIEDDILKNKKNTKVEILASFPKKPDININLKPLKVRKMTKAEKLKYSNIIGTPQKSVIKIPKKIGHC